ncbi:MAG: hypothetical protein KGJ66_02090 [Alphaproteobacteria bacterium]|nr:hypothetical protein [Alphaproteobacteria bacterium]
MSAVNGKVSAAAGDIGGHGGVLGAGSVSVPLAYSFGAQFDAAGGGANGRGLWGVAGQGFWRDPAVGLVGGLVVHAARGIAAGSNATAKGTYVNRYGVEAEDYLGRFTPSLAAGYQDGNLLRKPGGFAVLELGWYPVDDLELAGGGDLNSAHSSVLLGGEWQPGLAALPGLTGFVMAALSGQRDSYALVGVRLYFGPVKPLIRRHREDDPDSPIPDTLNSAYSVTVTTSGTGGGGGGGCGGC